MDPEAALARCRAMAAEIVRLEDGPDEPGEVRRKMATFGVHLAEQFQALDQWMARGGFAPADWRAR